LTQTVGTLVGPARVFWRQRRLTNTLVSHEITSQYSNGIYSLIWAVVTPLATLSVYTFVFGYILKSSFHGMQSGSSPAVYALGLFTGLILWDFFSSVINLSPSVIASKPNYVKKVVFPLEILPVVLACVALFHFLINSAILLLGVLIFGAQPAWRLLVLPVLLTPILFYTLGLSWLLASIGVFYRDLGNAITPLLQLLWFASAIFFPIASVPAQWRWLFYLNPVAAMVDETRQYAILGKSLNGPLIGTHLLIGWLLACAGLYFFRRSKPGFADVL
jgi:lipopolysaccharide transport system permease protein